MDDKEPEEDLTTVECAERKGVKRQTIFAAIKRGVIPARKRGRDYWIKQVDCDNYTPALSHKERGARNKKKREEEK